MLYVNQLPGTWSFVLAFIKDFLSHQKKMGDIKVRVDLSYLSMFLF
jgi:hypothetical protein